MVEPMWERLSETGQEVGNRPKTRMVERSAGVFGFNTLACGCVVLIVGVRGRAPCKIKAHTPLRFFENLREKKEAASQPLLKFFGG